MINSLPFLNANSAMHNGQHLSKPVSRLTSLFFSCTQEMVLAMYNKLNALEWLCSKCIVYLAGAYAALMKKIWDKAMSQPSFDSSRVNGSNDSEAIPFSLSNIGNSCYLASSLQVLFNFEAARERLYFALEDGRRGADTRIQGILNPLMDLCEVSQNNDHSLSYSEPVLTDPVQSALFSLRFALFSSGLHCELRPQDLIEQMDPAFVIELFMRKILKYKFITQKVFSTEQIRDRIFYGPRDNNYILQLAIENEREGEIELHLSTLIENHFKARTEQDWQQFNLSEEEEIVVGNEAPSSFLSKTKTIRVNSYESTIRLRTLPDIMAVQIKRFDSKPVKYSSVCEEYQEVKKSDSIILPENGILDFSKYYGTLEEANNQTKPVYDIMGYITHLGDSTKSGHYVSYVKKGNRFWHCNDLAMPPFEEISEQEFYSHRQSYILILSRVSPC